MVRANACEPRETPQSRLLSLRLLASLSRSLALSLSLSLSPLSLSLSLFSRSWLKWQVDRRAPLYGQRGKYTEAFRTQHRNAHLIGLNVDGTPRNLSVPSHVPWTGGVLGARVDLSIRWETGPEGMKSSKGDAIVAWRAWESADENRRRGVPEALLGGHPAFGDPPKTS
jgi:hypothetical protein